jgi:hypothetical protein
LDRHFDKEFFVFAIFLFAATGVFWYSLTAPLCACLMVPSPAGKQALSMENSRFVSDTNVTLYLRSTGSNSVVLQTYLVKDSVGDQWQLNNWNPPGQPIAPNNLLIVNIAIGSASGGCGNACQYTGTPGSFASFQSSQSYTIIIATTSNSQFTFTVIR